jgi:hypothetical protein
MLHRRITRTVLLLSTPYHASCHNRMHARLGMAARDAVIATWRG